MARHAPTTKVGSVDARLSNRFLLVLSGGWVAEPSFSRKYGNQVDRELIQTWDYTEKKFSQLFINLSSKVDSSK